MLYLSQIFSAWFGSLPYGRWMLIIDIVIGIVLLFVLLSWWLDRRKWKNWR